MSGRLGFEEASFQLDSWEQNFRIAKAGTQINY